MSRQVIKNNVHVSGLVISERVIDTKTVKVTVGINANDTVLPVVTIVDDLAWEKFKDSFPNTYTSVTISGQLQSVRDDQGATLYSIRANSISCFHNVLAETLDETVSQFHGVVILKRKFDFDTASKLYLKRMLFETIHPERPAVFEAMALRGAAPYFDSFKEGEKMVLKANYVIDKSGKPPYWRIKHQPESLS